MKYFLIFLQYVFFFITPFIAWYYLAYKPNRFWAILFLFCIFQIAVICILSNMNNINSAWENTKIKAAILNAPAVTVNGNCVNGKFYVRDENGVFQVGIAGKDPVKCK